MLINNNFSKMFIKITNLNYLNDKQHNYSNTYSNTGVIIISVPCFSIDFYIISFTINWTRFEFC